MCPPPVKGTNVNQANTPVGEVFERLLGPRATVSISAYDGSSSGPAAAPGAIQARSPLALDYLMSSPGDLGLARAYVAGALDVTGDLYTALHALSAQADQLTPAWRRGPTTPPGPPGCGCCESWPPPTWGSSTRPPRSTRAGSGAG